MILPDAVVKEIDEAKWRKIGAADDEPNTLLWITDAERIALLAYRSGVEAGIRATKEAAVLALPILRNLARDAIENMPEQPILDQVLKERG